MSCSLSSKAKDLPQPCEFILTILECLCYHNLFILSTICYDVVVYAIFNKFWTLM